MPNIDPHDYYRFDGDEEYTDWVSKYLDDAHYRVQLQSIQKNMFGVEPTFNDSIDEFFNSLRNYFQWEWQQIVDRRLYFCIYTFLGFLLAFVIYLWQWMGFI